MSGNNFDILGLPQDLTEQHNSNPASTAQQLDTNATNDSFIGGEGQSFLGNTISGPPVEQLLNSVDLSHMSDQQIWDMFQDTSTSIDFFGTVPANSELPASQFQLPTASASSNPNNSIPVVPAPTLAQPTSGPIAASNNGDIVGPWPLAPAVIPGSTSAAANGVALPMPDPSALYPASAAQPGSSSQSAQPYNDVQFLRDIGCDPDTWTNFNTCNPESIASQIPIEGQLLDFDLFNNGFNPWMEPAVEENAPSTTAAVNPALVPSAPGIAHAQATNFPQPRQPLVAPQLANSGANNVVLRSSASTLGQARYGAPNNASGSFSSFGMGMPGIGGFNTQAMAFSGALSQPSQVLQHPQIPQRAHRARNAQPRQVPRLIQGPPQLHPDLYRSILTTNGTPQFITARPYFQPPFFPARPAGRFVQIPNTNTPAGRITSTRVNPPLNNHAAGMKYYRDTKKRALELKEQKMMNQLLAAQLQEVRARDQAREQQLHALAELLSTVVQPEAEAGTAVPSNGGPPALQPGPNSSALAASQPVAFAQGGGIMQPLLFSGVPVQVQQYQQQHNFIPQAQPYFQIDDLHQLSNQRPEEHHRGMLQQQQVEQLQLHGSLPQGTTHLTNGYHRHQGDGATSSSGSSSKRKRDESREQGKKHKEAGGNPSPLKRRRENKSRGEGKEQGVATGTDNGEQNEYGDQAGAPSNQVGGSSNDAQPAEEDQPEPESQIEIQEDGPFTYSEALKFLLRGRYCEWDKCNHLIEPRFGAYWEHVAKAHKARVYNGKTYCAVSGCGCCVMPENMASHFDNRRHMNDKWLKCLECGEELKRDELGNARLHYKRNVECDEGRKQFAVVEKIRPPLRLKAEIPIPANRNLRQGQIERHLASVAESQNAVRMAEERERERRRQREELAKSGIDGQV
ncbi:hypothetical protein H1R20_g100, partial [Candolleomyces eurysporus]